MASTAEDSFSRDFASSLRLSQEDASDPAYLTRSASAPPTRDEKNDSGQAGKDSNESGFLGRVNYSLGGTGVNVYSNNSKSIKSSGEKGANAGQPQPQQYQGYTSYIPSPGMRPVNMMPQSPGYFAMSGVAPPSPHMFPGHLPQDIQGGSPYMGATSLGGYSLTPQFQAASSGAQFDYFRMMSQGLPPTASPGLGPVPSPYSHPLLPQSLLGSSGIGTPPDRNAAAFAAHLQQQQTQHVEGDNYSASQMGNYAYQQAAVAAAHQYSPGLGPANGYYNPTAMQQQQYYSGAGFVQQSPSMMAHQMMPQTLHMPLMAQLPPAAQQGSGPEQGGARYLREVSDPSPRGEATDSTPSTSGKSTPRSLSLPVASNMPTSDWGHDSGSKTPPSSKESNASTTVNSSGNTASGGTGKKSSLLEELRSKMKHASPTNARGGRQQQNQSAGFNDYQQKQQVNSYYDAVAGSNVNHQQFSNGGKPKSPTNMGNGGVTWGLRAIQGQVCEFAKDQHGSRFIQQQLESSTVSMADKQALFKEVLPYARMLCTDVFGNYVVQKLLDPNVGTPAQQEQLCQEALEGDMLELSMHMYGCRVVQKLVEKVFGEEGNQLRQQFADPQYRGTPGSILYDTRYQDSLLHELSAHVVKCVQDQNGNHVIQKCIEQIRPISRIGFILDAFRGNVCNMAKHPYGCRVVQRVLENCEQDRICYSLSELIAEINTLVQDQYGNYVVQHIIEGSRRKHPTERKRLIKAVQDNVMFFSMHKFASNVVEKCLQYGDTAERREIIERMLEKQTNPDGTISKRGCALQQMMKDPYANYVVQKVMDMAQPDQRDRVLSIVRDNAPALKRLTYGKHILARLDKLSGQSTGPEGGQGSNNNNNSNGGFKGKRQYNNHHNQNNSHHQNYNNSNQ
mmetsp:Transcript_4076/g.5978  ORF Transcript_4076/g.5978 Transcript_4076/m.5978 type:complete len:901 (+) Transcript_4076:229-2931(+)|eukprot:CAMPEP_0203743870 /NCGR_PEP_ID=MMETSP0098-20131031/124_1 /ASSEMBLY_ACC=CAM_ASM_000208 /TAXON_ID=96639 /ORGANISM=" , Strain NY0313808BC1" /LENGTH=900 /DNA_ID=CAMNT_0050631211 /DNA_START=228 /DNA_END=2930 /DNA_ORIENTATION=-